MKKKIVYISGADVFDVNDVRAAFEEVRNTLKLDADTVLFGVPVDEAESIGDVSTPTEITPIPVVDDAPTPVVEIESDNVEIGDVVEPVVDTESDAPVVPILSVLASQEDGAPQEQEIIDSVSDTKVEDAKVVEDVVKSETVILDESEPDIADMINDEIPTESNEKTLEELLETMTPLREDVAPTHKKKTSKVEANVEPVDEIDATLENLASEFAENQDKVVGPKKGAERGKIGKLKNILPFKKMKRDDSGLMGDLFGWAGIAANDDDFTIPGFFKQKM